MNWKAVFRLRPRDSEIDEEIEAHLRMAVHDRMERGESPQQARYGALRELGNALAVKESVRDVWAWKALEELLQDLRFAVRILTKSPAFGIAAITLIALGIGGNATVYSMVNAVFNKNPPGVHADRLISLGIMKDGHEDDPGNSYPNYTDYVAESRTLRPLLARGWGRFTVTLDKAAYGVWATLVTANYFETLGVRLAKGRPFTEEEGRLDASGLVVVISHRFWQEAFQGADDIVGRRIALNGHPATVIGVAPQEFRGPHVAEHDDVWVPLLSYARIHGIERALNERSIDSPDAIGVELIGRLAPGASLSQARAEFDVISKRLQKAYPQADQGRAALVVPYSALGPGIGPVRLFMKIMMVVAILALLVVCANVANLMLSRSVFRQREMAVRKSLGASRNRVFRMLMAEGLVLSLTALVAAWLFVQLASRGLLRLITQDAGQTLNLDFTPDWRVAGYASALALFSTLVFTAAPAVRAWREDPLAWLKAGQHGVVEGRSRLSGALIVTQLALCVVLIAGAGLAYRSQSLIDHLDLRYRTDHLAIVTLGTTAGAADKEQNAALLERLRERLRAVPGVLAASYAREAPLRGGLPVGPVQRGALLEPVPARGNYVGPDFLKALGVVPLQGRGVSEQDRAGTKKIVVINRNLAKALWPKQSALGRTLLLDGGKELAEVVGVVPNGIFADLRQTERDNFLFLAERQSPAEPGEVTFHIRHAGSLDAIAPSLRAAIRETDARVPVFDLRSMEAQVRSQTGPVRMIVTLLSVFGIGALLVAAIGLYAVIAFNLSRRTRDFGIRMALGASSGQIVGAMLREGLLMTVAGLAIGFAISLAGSKALGALLFGVTATDVPTYIGVFALLAIVSLLACYLPARRAARIDPMQALRQE